MYTIPRIAVTKQTIPTVQVRAGTTPTTVPSIYGMLGGGGTVSMVQNTEGTRQLTVPNVTQNPFAETLITTAFPYDAPILTQPLLDKPIDSSCHNANSLYTLALNVFSAYQQYLKKIPPDSDMVNPFKLVFPHGTDTLATVTGILHYMILQMGLNMTVVPIAAIKPSDDPVPDGLANIKTAVQFLQNHHMPGAFAVRTNPATNVAIILEGNNIQKIATQGSEWLQPNPNWHPYIITATDSNQYSINTYRKRVLSATENTISKKVANQFNTVTNLLKVLRPLGTLQLIPNVALPETVATTFPTNLTQWFHTPLKTLTNRLTHNIPKQGSAILVEQTATSTITHLNGIPTLTLPVTPQGDPLSATWAWAKAAALLMMSTPPKELAQKFYTLSPWEQTTQLYQKTAPLLAQNHLSNQIPGLAYVKVTPTLSATEVLNTLKAVQQQSNTTAKYLVFEGVGNGHIPIGQETLWERVSQQLPRVLNQYRVTNTATNTIMRTLKTTHTQEPINSITQLQTLLTAANIDHSTATAMLQDCFAHSNTVLNSIHIAIKQGIEVWVGTGVPQGVANQAYSVGELLAFMGVKTMGNPLPQGLSQLLKTH